MPELIEENVERRTSNIERRTSNGQLILKENPGAIARSEFNPEGRDPDEELIDSVKAHGIIQPLVVRPGPKFELVPPGVALGWRITRNRIDVQEFRKSEEAKARAEWEKYAPIKYELIAGERRLKAAKALKLPEVPIILRQASDLEVIELQTIENEQRKDLSPIQKAEKYQQALDEYGKAGITGEKAIARLAEKVGKKKSTIYGALQLVKLPEPVKEAVSSGKLPASHAGEIAKLEAAPEVQKSVLKQILAPDSQMFRVEKQETDAGNEVMSFRSTKELIKKETKLTAARKEFEAIKAKHIAKGGKVLSPEEREKAVTSYGAATGAYVKGSDFTYDYGKGYGGNTYAKLMGKHAPATVLTYDGNYRPLHLYRKSEAIAAIEKAGHKKKSADRPASRTNYEALERKRKEKQKRLETVAQGAIDKVIEASSKSKPKFPWGWVFGWIFEQIGLGTVARDIVKRHGWKKTGNEEKTIVAKIGSLSQAQIQTLLLEIALDPDELTDYGRGWDSGFVELSKYYGIDLAKLEAEVAPAPAAAKKVQASGRAKKTKGKGGKK